jgi:hypothetical protein|tara:strand:- start:2914 stop:3237 length:324 start_codon:yes stop_codon:yes gene_type:complete
MIPVPQMSEEETNLDVLARTPDAVLVLEAVATAHRHMRPATTRSVMKQTGLSEAVVRHRAMALFHGEYLHLANPTQGQIPESYQMRAKGWTLVKGSPPYGWDEGNLV